MDSFNRGVKRRDLIEISTAIIMSPIFAYLAYWLPNVLAKIGAGLIAIWCLYVIYKLLRVKRTRPIESNSYLEYIKESKEYLERQKGLLDKIIYWYILPGLMGCVMVMIGQLDLFSMPWQSVLKNKIMWRSLSVFIGVGVFTYWLNKKAIKKEFIPRLKKVDELIYLMEKDEAEI